MMYFNHCISLQLETSVFFLNPPAGNHIVECKHIGRYSVTDD